MEQDKKVTIIPDAIIIPTGGTVRGKDGKFHSTTYEDGDAFGVLGGYARVEAASLLAKEFSNAMLITTGRGGEDGILPTHAEVMRQELIRFGVEPQRIILEEQSTSTKSGIEEAVSIAESHGWHSLFFVTNEYHLPRLEIMLKMAKTSISVKCIPAEKVIIDARPSFLKEYENIQASPQYRQRLISESSGIEALLEGHYKEAPRDDKKERLV